ncbi:MAG: hypothetical protein WCJ35_27310 [Planctomycetota bacterium]
MTQNIKTSERFRRALFNEMLPGTQAATVVFDRNRRRFHRGKTLIHFDVGKEILSVLADPSTYGADALGQIAEYLGMEVERLYAFRDVAEAFDRGLIERECQIPMGCGRFLDIVFFAELVPLRDDDEQFALVLQRIRDEDLSLIATRRLVRRVLLGHRLTKQDA